MRRFAAEFFAQSPVLLLPVITLVLFFIVFLAVIVHVMRMKKSEADAYAHLPLEDEMEVPHE
ncbi:MAG: CcoQ/FixQ family Cbb3-type cytochrome c oxidase assembly chaperone [Myxococcales bacterium]|jgi:cbb3-type cytochrome oxidase subunit 3|nr:cbb3-type cytochrome c oxidase subunit 3 [Deltaproteobacteria bacterium]MBW2222947.1 cbb3-type cytochrome c oxidase subunit 3 [Deltaproteobacteria bacterium]MBW2405044.1 cbb3-type cytochrome c oxidase subunit 3 [Deltaproteobacteria bacterium]NOQ84243.1 CcoQ/FixQ family Cbb3-type cytochrome c oxidase assembly chaperone [Myxococcales bacterium]